MNKIIMMLCLFMVSPLSAQDPFNAAQRNGKQQTDIAPTLQQCRKTQAVIAEQYDFNALIIRGVILQAHQQSVLFEADNQLFIAHPQDFISRQQGQILAIEKHEIRIADWQNSPDCNKPLIRTMKF